MPLKGLGFIWGGGLDHCSRTSSENKTFYCKCQITWKISVYNFISYAQFFQRQTQKKIMCYFRTSVLSSSMSF